MKIHYFQKSGGYIAVTEESPKDFKNVLYVGRGPAKPGQHGTVEEQVYSIEELKKLPRVEKDQLPDEWLEAFGYELPEVAVVEAIKPKPAPKPKAEKQPASDPDYRQRGWRPVRRPAKVPPRKISEALSMFLAGVILFGILSWQIMYLLQ